MGWLQDTVQNFWLIDSRVITEHYGHFNQGKGRSPPPFKYLESLPNTIPQLGSETTKYGFNLVDNDDLEDRGLVGTFNCQRDSRVKIHLYHCNNGPIISRKGQVSPSWSPQAHWSFWVMAWWACFRPWGPYPLQMCHGQGNGVMDETAYQRESGEWDWSQELFNEPVTGIDTTESCRVHTYVRTI